MRVRSRFVDEVVSSAIVFHLHNQFLQARPFLGRRTERSDLTSLPWKTGIGDSAAPTAMSQSISHSQVEFLSLRYLSRPLSSQRSQDDQAPISHGTHSHQEDRSCTAKTRTK